METIISTIFLDQGLQILLMDGLLTVTMVYGNKTKQIGSKMCAVIGMGLMMGIMLDQLALLLM